MTRRREISVTAGVVAALVLSVLAASAPPVGVADAEEVVQAADGLVVGSERATATELSNGNIQNADVVRSDDAGAVEHDTYRNSAASRWAFDTTDSSTAFDHVGDNHLTLTGPTRTNGVRGNALNFDGINDHATAPDTGVASSGGFTFSAWVDPTDSRGRVVDYGNSFIVDIVGTDVEIFGDGYTTVGSLPSGQLSHLAISVSSSGIARAYINGDLVHTWNWDVANNRPTGRIDIGVDEGDDRYYYDGSLDDLRFYNEPLSPGLITDLATQPAGKLSPTASTWASFDAGEGSTAFWDNGSETQISGADWTEVSVSGSALDFSGSGSVDVPDGVVGTDAFSITASFRSTNSSKINQGILNLRDDVNAFLELDGETLVWYDGTDAATASGLQSGEWHTATVVYTGSESQLFVDGQLQDTLSNQIESLSDESSIGGRDGFEGQIDEVGIYDEELPAQQAEYLTSNPGNSIPESSTYQSPPQSVSGSNAQGWTDLELHNATATVTWQTTDGTVLNQTTYTTSGNYTATWSRTDTDKEVVVDVNESHPDSYARLDDEGILFTPQSPKASNATPTDGTTLTDLENTLSVNVNDSDFPTAQGDSVDVTFYVDGEQRGTSTLTSNGTASTNVTTIGDTEWYAVLEDEYGQQTTTPARTYSTPNELEVRKELQPQELIDGDVNLTVRAYAGDTVISRTVSDGMMSLKGFPIDQPIVITATGDNYVDRRIIIDDIAEQQRIYLLNASANSYPVVFELSDKTGRFPPESSQLYIQKALNVSGTEGLEWETITGDYFSADLRFPTELAANQRYRIVIQNENGNRRVLGSYIPYAATTTTLQIGEIVWDIPSSEGVYSTTRYDENGNLEVLYNDTRGATTRLNVTAWNRSTGEQVYQAITENVQQTVETIPVDGDVIVSIEATRDGEPDYSYRGPVGDPDIEQGLPFGKWLKLGAQVLMLGIAGLVVGHMPKQGGLVIVPIAFGVAWMGIWEIHPASLGIAGALALAAATNRGGA